MSSAGIDYWYNTKKKNWYMPYTRVYYTIFYTHEGLDSYDMLREGRTHSSLLRFFSGAETEPRGRDGTTNSVECVSRTNLCPVVLRFEAVLDDALHIVLVHDTCRVQSGKRRIQGCRRTEPKRSREQS